MHTDMTDHGRMTMHESSNYASNSRTKTWNPGNRTIPGLFPTTTRPIQDLIILLRMLFLSLRLPFLLCKNLDMKHLQYLPRIILYLGPSYRQLIDSSGRCQVNLIVEILNPGCKQCHRKYLHSLWRLTTVDRTQMQAPCLLYRRYRTHQPYLIPLQLLAHSGIKSQG
jgi:hypothetical protein